MKNVTAGRFGGFTLVELLVVVLIIGILAAVAVPQYQKAVAKSRYMNLVTAGKSLKDAMEIYYLANGTYPSYWNQLDIEYPGCEASSTHHYMLWCDKFAVDMFSNDDKVLYFFDTHGIENNGRGLGEDKLGPKTQATYKIWLDHSDTPGKTACASQVQGLCKSLGFE